MKKHLTLLILTLSSICTFAQIPNYVPTIGLVGYWPFNGNANDESGNGNNGTVYGASLTTDRFGVINKCYDFQNNTIEIQHSLFLGFEPNNSFSIGLWVYKDGSQNLMHLIGKRAQFSPNFNWQIANGSTLNFESGTGPGVTIGLNSLSSLVNQTWTYIVGTYNNTSWKLYINGNLISTNTGNAEPDNLSNLTIGNSGGFEPFYGKIDDIGIWNRALTQCEIADLYNSQLGSLTTSSTLTETALDLYTLNGQVFTESGTYTQVIQNAAGCDSTITLNLSLDFTGISELDKEFSIAPNPATDQLTISTNTFSNEKYILFDPQGRQVLSGSLTGTTTQLDLSKLARGNYLLQIGEKLTPVKLVKE